MSDNPPLDHPIKLSISTITINIMEKFLCHRTTCVAQPAISPAATRSEQSDDFRRQLKTNFVCQWQTTAQRIVTFDCTTDLHTRTVAHTRRSLFYLSLSNKCHMFGNYQLTRNTKHDVLSSSAGLVLTFLNLKKSPWNCSWPLPSHKTAFSTGYWLLQF